MVKGMCWKARGARFESRSPQNMRLCSSEPSTIPVALVVVAVAHFVVALLVVADRLINQILGFRDRSQRWRRNLPDENLLDSSGKHAV